jgi:NAD(P)H-quinone oxidoreductase subunit 4L
MHLTINHFLVLASILFCIGLYGVLVKRNAVAILMCIELMLNAVNILLVAFNHYTIAGAEMLTGQIFVIFVMTVAAAEVAVGLAIIIVAYRNRKTVDVDKIDLMKW